MSKSHKRSPEALSPTQEHYLRAIWLIQSDKGYARVTDIGNELGVAKAAVSAAVKALRKEGLVDHRHYEQVLLTEKGIRNAQEISSRYAIIHTFLEEVLGIEKDAAVLDSCLLEHYVSAPTIDRLIDLIRFFETDKEQEVLERFREYRRKCESDESCRICNFHCDVVISPGELIVPNLPGNSE